MSLDEIIPTERQLVMDLVREAGVDVADWANGRGGKSRAAMNPRYCYEWSFVEPGKLVVLNLWHAEMRESQDTVSIALNLKKVSERETPRRKLWAKAMDNAIRTAFSDGLPVRVIVLEGQRRNIDNAKATRASMRLLDPTLWAVTEYNSSTGACTIVRGGLAIAAEQPPPDEILDGFEGAARRRFVRHRQREAKLRLAKLAEARQRNKGRLLCEVARCGFDFSERYGDLGKNYAQVHHLEPLSDAPDTGRRTTLDMLAVVCANCHVMIHVGGQCRQLDDLIPRSR